MTSTLKIPRRIQIQKEKLNITMRSLSGVRPVARLQFQAEQMKLLVWSPSHQYYQAMYEPVPFYRQVQNQVLQSRCILVLDCWSLNTLIRSCNSGRSIAIELGG